MMLVIAAGLYCMMAGPGFSALGAPYLFWHDQLITRALALIGVGMFIEEWVYLGMLLDDDHKNPAKRIDGSSSASESPGAESQMTRFEAESRAAVRSQGVAAQRRARGVDNGGNLVFEHVRDLHTWATLALCLTFCTSAWTIFYWRNLAHGAMEFWCMLLSAAYFPFAGAFMVFTLRRTFLCLSEADVLGKLERIPLLGRIVAWPVRYVIRFGVGETTLAEVPVVRNLIQLWERWTSPENPGEREPPEPIDGRHRRLHVIAFGKNLVVLTVVAAFCALYWRGAKNQFALQAGLVFASMAGHLLWVIPIWPRFFKSVSWPYWLFAVVNMVTAVWIWRGLADSNTDDLSSVALIASLVFTFGTAFMGWIVFQSRRPWFELIVVVGAVLAGFTLWNMRTLAQPLAVAIKKPTSQRQRNGPWQRVKDWWQSPRPNGDVRPPTVDGSLRAIQQKAEDSDLSTLRSWESSLTKDNGGDKPILVVVSHSGGGIKAQVWSTAVVCALEKMINEQFPDSQPFHRHVRLVTGTSGGMVGGAYWVATLNDGNRTYKRAPFHFDRDRKRVKFVGLDPEDMLLRMSEDVLDDVARQFFYNDFLGLPYNLFVGATKPGGWKQLDSRGEALESALERHGSAFGKTLRDLKAAENAGLLPTLAFAPTVANDGRRMLISNQPLESLLHVQLPFAGEDVDGSGSSISGHSWATSFPNLPLKISRAARLNANFPLFVNSPAAPLGNMNLRLMDAGYIDNYGLVISSRWLEQHQQWLREHTAGVLLVQAAASHLERDDVVTSAPTSSPVVAGFANSSFNKTLHHGDYTLSRLAKSLNKDDPSFFRMVSFDYEGDASLTWYLSKREKFSLIYPFLGRAQLHRLQAGDLSPRNAGCGADPYRSNPPIEISDDSPLLLAGRSFLRSLERAMRPGHGAEGHERVARRLHRSRFKIRRQLDSTLKWWEERTQQAGPAVLEAPLESVDWGSPSTQRRITQ